MTPELNWDRVETEWSPGNRERLNGLLKTHFQCVDAPPSIARTSMRAICGNGVLERNPSNVVDGGQDEVCDCLDSKATTDDECACCDTLTSQYKQVGETVVLDLLFSVSF